MVLPQEITLENKSQKEQAKIIQKLEPKEKHGF
jgi:hypothetical protein